MKFFVDAMGGDNAPLEIIKGSKDAIDEYNIEITLVGNEEIIKKCMTDNDIDDKGFTIVHASEVVTNDDEPAKAVRRKKDSSLVVGMKLVKDTKDSVIISAGSTGAVLTAALFEIGRIKGIQRPALAVTLPTRTGYCLLTDCGANADCRPEYLVQFAKMGAIYMENVMGIENPRIALANIGSEEKKGNSLTKEAHQLLKEANLNFTGNIEARYINAGVADVVVTDGFTGNMILKLMEGTARFILGGLKDAIKSSFKNKLAGGVLRPSLKQLNEQLDYNKYGGTPFLGIKGGVIKAHGSSKAESFKSAIYQAIKLVDNNVIEKIMDEISKA